MPGRRTAARPGRSPGAALRALVALVVLLALCVGIPMVLVALASTSLPHGVPAPSDLLSALTRRDDGTLFLAVLTLAAWVGWATFAVAVLLEVPAQVRGVPAVRVRGLGVQQSLAGGLVAAVLAMVLVPTAAGASVRPSAFGAAALTSPAAGVVVAAASAAPGLVSWPAEAAESAADSRSPASAVKVHEVRAGDTLWDLAAEYLGDGSQWRRIADLNYDRAQPGGGHLDRSHTLQPGWHLELPTVPHAAEHQGHDHVVRRGETLSGIALHELGDGSQYPELARATEDVQQPDGRHLTDPDLIYPGWHVKVPGAWGEPSPPPHVAAPGAHRGGAPAVDPLDPSWGQAPDPAPGTTRRSRRGGLRRPYGPPPPPRRRIDTGRLPRASTRARFSTYGPPPARVRCSRHPSWCSSAPAVPASGTSGVRASGSPCPLAELRRRKPRCAPSPIPPVSRTSTSPCATSPRHTAAPDVPCPDFARPASPRPTSSST